MYNSLSVDDNIYIYIYIYIYMYYGLVGIVGRVFGFSPRHLNSNPGRVVPKTQKWYSTL